eukprot:NODE_50_length_31184_cov_0.705099.p20 type:complete len:211 gc:universal NODE_50_length_31184_cov_0.705099:15891-16523(+)
MNNNCKWSQCQESYASAKELFDHMCEVHINVMGTQKFTRECKWDGCDAKVERRHHLVSHIRIHVNFKPFVCQYCGKSYKWAHDSKRHVRKCTSNPDQKAPLSAPAQMTMMNPFSPHSQLMSPVDYMRSPLENNQQWNRLPFPALNFQNMQSPNQMMMSPTTPPTLHPQLMQNYKDDMSMSSSQDFELPRKNVPLSVQIPMHQKFENVHFF